MTRNEAAERLLRDYHKWTHEGIAVGLDAALAAERRATVERMVALLDEMIAHPRNEPRYRAAFAGLKVARRAIFDEEAAR